MNYQEFDNVLDDRGVIYLLSNYNLPSEYLISRGIDKSILLESPQILDENSIQYLIDNKYFQLDDLKNLSMSILSNLSKDWISKYSKNIDWSKIILYALATESISNFDSIVETIESNSLWDMISAYDLPIEFIRKYKEKLNWSKLSVCRSFSNGEKLEFSEYLPKEKEIEENSLIDIDWEEVIDKLHGK